MPDLTEPTFNAERLRALLILTLAEHNEIIACRPVESVYRDRLGVAVMDRAGRTWRLHVLIDPRS